MKPRQYVHFDRRISRAKALEIAGDPCEVRRHRFYPFLAFTQSTRKTKWDKDEHRLVRQPPKDRDIKYACHADSAIYSFYAEKLAGRYDPLFEGEDLSDNVTAFRSLDRKTNIEFAFEAFEWIRTHGPCVALAFDVKGFFDNLDHGVLKQTYAEVLGCTRLPEDHYKAFRSVTEYSWVETDDLRKEFGAPRHHPWRGRDRICTPEEFRSRVLGGGLVHVNRSGKGIPQGSPISAVLSNVYLLNVDRKLAREAKAMSGFYRRYCDDILFVVPPKFADRVEMLTAQAIEDAALEIQSEKTDRCAFGFDAFGTLKSPKALQYLGFTFDGERIQFRSSSVQRYMNRMTESAWARARDWRKVNERSTASGRPPRPLHRRKLLSRYSPVGKRNFIRYGHRAVGVTGSASLRRQIRRMVRKLEATVEQAKKANS